tara:strand:+ start:65 stop:430 length:366 start_codon:yes stop_codon:yes gene_type:complete
MVQNEAQLWKYLKNKTPQITWVKIENTSHLGTPDLLGYNKNKTFFTVELKVTKRHQLKFSPHQIAFHIQHPKNSYILAMQLVGQELKLYEGNQIEILATRGMKLEARCEGLANCIGKLEAL